MRTMGSVGSVSSDAGWEWRFFVPVPLDEGELPLAGQREDIYFPAGEGYDGRTATRPPWDLLSPKSVK